MEQVTLLRATAQRLSTTPVEDLPRIAGFLASSIASCGTALRQTPSQSEGITVPLHNLNTRLSSLLQDKTSAGRFTAAVVIKSYVELSHPSRVPWESWTRNLIACLNKQDPWEAKRVYLSTIVRILLLCQRSLQLQREVSTPLLPAFITATLSIIRPQSKKTGSTSTTVTTPILPCVLRSWNEVLQNYGNTLRPFVPRIQPICLSILSESAQFSQLRDLAAQVLASLHRCASKNVSMTEWDSGISTLVKTAHATLDHIFRGVFEDWSSNDALNQRPSIRFDYSKRPEIQQADAAGLWPWKGIHSGTLRVMNLLCWIESMLHCASQPATVPIGLLVDLLARIMSVTIPEMDNIAQYPLRLNPEVGKEEREELWSNLPELHTSSLHLCETLLLIFGQSMLPAGAPLANQVLDLFDAEKWCTGIRLASYRFMISLLHKNNSICSQLQGQSFQVLCRSCCIDINDSLRSETVHEISNVDTIRGGPNGVPKSSQPPKTPTVSDQSNHVQSPVVKEALNLMAALLDRAPAAALPSSVRAEIDRLTILTGHEAAMYASVMNPPLPRVGQRLVPSLIPFLARDSAGGNLALEALIRPRMPSLSGMRQQKDMRNEVEDQDAHAGTNSREEDSMNNHEPGDDTPRQWLSTIGNTQTPASNTAQADAPNFAVNENDSLRKRAYAAVHDSEPKTDSDSFLQASKKPRKDFSEPQASSMPTPPRTVQTTLSEPQLMRGSEGIISFGGPPLEQHTDSTPAVLQAATGSGDDSDESEIPAINAQLAEDLMNETEDEEVSD